ncbi:MAG TPA: zinc ribbon domain-containing protein [Pyrinomonadaceae bacterium]|nr:zinc ribbon domain-containing protein [Pyrinomonadaceae bacterium]
MYCSACGTPLTPGLSYCNRCGASLRERPEPKGYAIPAFLTAITLIAIAGLGIMLGGALTLSTDAGMPQEVVGFFMLFTFLIVVLTEVLLVRQLSRLTANVERTSIAAPPTNFAPVAEPRSLPSRAAGEPLPSVTENTTRTLEYSRHQS